MSEPHPERAWQFDRLRHALRGLAWARVEQPALFPDSTVTADALAREFDRCVSSIRATYEPDLQPAQQTALSALEDAFATMARDAVDFDAEVWTDGALTANKGWVEVRHRALTALEAFGWAVE